MLARISASTSFRATAISLSQRHLSTNKRPNNALISMLKAEIQEDKDKPKSATNYYKTKSLQNAVNIISKLDYEITSLDAVKDIDGIGLGIMKRIREHLVTTHSSKGARKNRAECVLELQSIPGIGEVTAEKLAKAGCNGLEDLRQVKFLEMLSLNQRVYFQFAKHLENPVSNEEIEIVTEFIRANLSPKYEVITVGNYRRGATESIAINVMLFHPDHVHVPVPLLPLRGSHVPQAKQVNIPTKMKAEVPLHKVIVGVFQERGLIARDMSGGLHYLHALARIPEKDVQGRWGTRGERLAAIDRCTGEYRRLHLYMMPIKSRGAALISHTGDAQMKKLLKGKAKKLGLYLDELGLWKWHSDEGEKEHDADEEDVPASGFWKLLNSTTEEVIFEQLGMEYIEPSRRNLSNVQ